MDPYQYAYSDASSGPRTPSPQALPLHSPANYKLDLEPVNVKPILVADPLADDQREHGIAPEALWQHNQAPYMAAPGSLLGELYEHELPMYSHPAPPPPQMQRVQHYQQDVGPMRRATYPYARQERDDLAHYTIPPFLPTVDDRRPQHVYAEPHPMLEHVPQQQLINLYEMSPSHSQSYEPRVKMEDTSSTIIPPQMLYRSHSMDHMHHPPTLPLMPHPAHPVQLTDDAASKETQYLRRRCTNCSQTEPPSWRRSTLNPGKIVCNKCGLYERTHMRPRPLRFDELRTGNKSRKSKKAPAAKGEHQAVPLARQVSASSECSWESDDSVSVGSSAASSTSSPASFSLPLERSSHSPTLLPNDSGIRLPNVDIASLSMHGSPQSIAPEFALQQADYYPVDQTGSPNLVSEANGWQQAGDMPSPGRRGSSILRKTVVA